jgi:hypothetical protein
MSRAPQVSGQRAQPLDIFRSEGYGRLPGLFLACYRPFEAITVHSRALGKTCVHSENGRLVVMTRVARSARSLMT